MSAKTKAAAWSAANAKSMPSAWKIVGNDGRVDMKAWNSGVKVRHFESIHLPEYKGWHNKGCHPD